MARRRRRRIFRLLLILVIGLAVLVLALPLWFPWALRPAAKSFDLNYAGYERMGYGRFRLTQVSVQTKAGIFHANTIEAPTPTAWLSRVFTSNKPRPFLKINDWDFVYQPSSNPPARAPSSVYTNFNRLKSSLAAIARWVPRAELSNGTVRVNDAIIGVPQALWTNGALSGRLLLPGHNAIAVDITPLSAQPWRLSARADSLNLRAGFSLEEINTRLHLAGTVFWLTNRIEIRAEFPRGGSFPETARINADSFDIPARLLKLDQYSYLGGSLNALWRTNHFTIDLRADASPSSNQAPPLNVEARASGDTNSAMVNVFRISGPGFAANFPEGTRVQFQPPFLTQPAALEFSVDMAQQPWFSGTGAVQGSVVLLPGSGHFPRATFRLNGSGVTISNLETRTLEITGEFNWPLLTLASARVIAADGSTASLTGSWNVADKTIGDSTLQYSGTFGRELLPRGYSFDNAIAQAQFHGPLSALVHSGRIEISRVRVPKSNPIQLNAGWSGNGRALERIDLALNAGDSSLTVAGAIHAGGGTNEATLSTLQFQTGNGDNWKLREPFRVAFRKPRANSITNTWSLDFEPMRLAGERGSLQVDGKLEWPERGNVHVDAQNLGTDVLKDFFTLTNFDGTLRQLIANGGWTNGPAVFGLEMTAGVKTRLPFEWIAQVSVNGSDNGIDIRQLSISSHTQTVVRAQGTLPIVFRPASVGNRFQADPRAPLQLQAFTDTNSVLWDELAKIGGVEIVRPELQCNVTGTWEQPEGRMTLTAQRLRFNRAKQPLPEIEDFDFRMEVNRNEAAVSELTARVAGQPVSARAEIPTGRGFWNGLLRRRALPEWREVTAQLKMENATIAAFGAFLPKAIAPQGKANVDLRLERGELRGEAVIEDAATRPLDTLGPVRNIGVNIFFTGHTLVLTNLTGEIAGEPITAHGSADLRGDPWRNKTIPPFQFHARGTNIPLVRKAGVLLRADLDIAITNSDATNAFIAGTVRLRDGFFMSGLDDLVPGKTAAPKRRPPYFSIEVEPLAHWRLGLKLEGDKFLKVRSPIFSGMVSATTRLEGTLKEPLALGEVRVDSGSVTFPFGSLAVKQGLVSLTSDNPYHPQLLVTATAQRMGYDIKMEATGPIDQPVIQFSSSPSLSSEEILLMLTAGQLPRGLANTTVGQRAQGLALFVGKNVLTELGIGGDGDGRLSIRSGEQLTETGRPTYQVEYELTDTWSLIGEYDRFDQYNLGLKWKVYSR